VESLGRENREGGRKAKRGGREVGNEGQGPFNPMDSTREKEVGSGEQGEKAKGEG